MRSSTLLGLVLGAASLAAVAAPALAGVDAVTPAEGTVGTEIVITGYGFGTGRARVSLVGEATQGRRSAAARVRVTSVTDTEIRAVVLRAARDRYDVVVRTRSRETFRADGAFQAVAPRMDASDLDTAHVGDRVTLTGQYLGVRRGRVRVGGRVARVTAWEDGSVTFRVPRIANGFHDVEVTSRTGTVLLDDAVVVTGSRVDTFARDCTCFVLGRRTVVWRVTDVIHQDGNLTVSGLWGKNQMAISFPCTPGEQEFPCKIDGLDGATMTVRLVKPPRGIDSGTYRAFGWTGTIDVMIGSVGDDGRVHGTYSGTLLMAQTNETLVVSGGRFSFTPPR